MKCAKTGLIVNFYGTGSLKINEQSIKSIAMRADMDALPIPENNPHLNYKS